MENLEIFDKSGKSLHIADVIYSFIKNVAEENNKAIEDVLVGVDVGFPKGKAPVWIYTTEPVNNGYDAIRTRHVALATNIAFTNNKKKQQQINT